MANGVTIADDSAKLPVAIIPVRPEQIEAVWDDAAPLIRLAQKRLEHETGMADIKDDLIANKLLLWLVRVGDKLRAVILTDITQHPRRRVLRILMIGGYGMSDWLNAGIYTMQKAAKLAACDAVQADGRLGWARHAPKCGFREVSRSYEMEIK